MKTITHIETRQLKGKSDIYIEIESTNYGDWNNLGTFVETLSAIDIHPQKNVLADDGNGKKPSFYH